MPYDNDQDNPYNIPNSELTVGTGPFIEWSNDSVRHAVGVVRNVLTCAWTGYFTFAAIHNLIYWGLRENIQLVLIELPWVILCAALALPLFVLLPSWISVYGYRKKMGVSRFVQKWEKHFRDIVGRPLTATLVWVGSAAVVASVFRGVLWIGLDIGMPDTTWLLAMLIALSVTFVISYPVCRLNCRSIENRIREMAISS